MTHVNLGNFTLMNEQDIAYSILELAIVGRVYNRPCTVHWNWQKQRKNATTNAFGLPNIITLIILAAVPLLCSLDI
jgi:hypothetical protein